MLAGIGGMFSASSGLVVEVPSDVAGWLDEAAASVLQRNSGKLYKYEAYW